MKKLVLLLTVVIIFLVTLKVTFSFKKSFVIAHERLKKVYNPNFAGHNTVHFAKTPLLAFKHQKIFSYNTQREEQVYWSSSHYYEFYETQMNGAKELFLKYHKNYDELFEFYTRLNPKQCKSYWKSCNQFSVKALLEYNILHTLYVAKNFPSEIRRRLLLPWSKALHRLGHLATFDYNAGLAFHMRIAQHMVMTGLTILNKKKLIEKNHPLFEKFQKQLYVLRPDELTFALINELMDFLQELEHFQSSTGHRGSKLLDHLVSPFWRMKFKWKWEELSPVLGVVEFFHISSFLFDTGKIKSILVDSVVDIASRIGNYRKDDFGIKAIEKIEDLHGFSWGYNVIGKFYMNLRYNFNLSFIKSTLLLKTDHLD